jgi:hypothetical protein
MTYEYIVLPPSPDDHCLTVTQKMNDLCSKGWRYVGSDGCRRNVFERPAVGQSVTEGMPMGIAQPKRRGRPPKNRTV